MDNNTPERTVRHRAACDTLLLDAVMSSSLTPEQRVETRKIRIWALVEQNFSKDELIQKVSVLKGGVVVRSILNSLLHDFSRSPRAIHIAVAIQEYLCLSQTKYKELLKIMSSTYDAEKGINVPFELAPGVPMFKFPSSYAVQKWKTTFDLKDIQLVCLINGEVQFRPVGPVDSGVVVLGAVRDIAALVQAEILFILNVLKPELHWRQGQEHSWAFSRTIDGTPFTKRLGLVLGTFQCLNLGTRIHEAEHTVISFVIYGSENQRAVEELIMKEDFEREKILKFTCNDIEHSVIFFEKDDEKMANWIKGQSTKSCNRPLGFADYHKSEFDDLSINIHPSRYYTLEKRIQNFEDVLEFANTIPEDKTEAEFNK